MGSNDSKGLDASGEPHTGAEAAGNPAAPPSWRDSIIGAFGLTVAGLIVLWALGAAASWLVRSSGTFKPKPTQVESWPDPTILVVGGVFLACLICWRAFIVWGGGRSEGARAGVFAAMLGHFFVALAISATEVPAVGVVASPRDKMPLSFFAMWLGSYLVCGWLTVPVGGLAGWLIATAQGRH